MGRRDGEGLGRGVKGRKVNWITGIKYGQITWWDFRRIQIPAAAASLIEPDH
jgi:hypothetical protein